MLKLAHMGNMGRHVLAHNFLIFRPIKKRRYIVAQETKSFRLVPDLPGFKLKLKMSFLMPIYGCGCDPKPDGIRGPETQPKVPPTGSGFWSTHISRMTFQKNVG